MPSRTNAWPATVAFGDQGTAARIASIPAGCIGYTATSTDTTGIVGTIKDLTDVEVAVTVGTDRLIVIKGFVPRFASDTANDAISMYVREGTDQIQTAFADLSARTASGSGGNHLYIETEPFSPSPGSHTYKLSVIRSTGGSGILATALTATARAWIKVMDEGEAF